MGYFKTKSHLSSSPLNLQQFLTQMENYLSSKSAKYLAQLPDPIVQNLEYHFHTLDYGDFCRLLNALRQTLQRLAQVLFKLNRHPFWYREQRLSHFCPIFHLIIDVLNKLGRTTLHEIIQDFMPIDNSLLQCCILLLVGHYNDER